MTKVTLNSFPKDLPKDLFKPLPLPKPKVVAEWKRLGLAEQRARARWRKPLPAIIADAVAANRGLLERLRLGVYGPTMKGKEQYQVLFNGLYQATQEQIEALEVFARVDWSE